ncbi:MAG: hypothetical protein PHI29_09310 [Gallionella sp.]|nr:hypothetical protein [Gallionella sp.]
MYKTIQRSLLILFALLQCMSPLAHAHVNGVDAGHIVYSHDFESSASSAESHAESEQGAVIAMSLAYPASDGPVVSHGQQAPLSNFTIFKPASFLAFSPNAYVIPAQSATQHVLPWAQAPPRLN